VLREAGVSTWDGEPLDEDLIALRAGTLLPYEPPEQSVPPGASNLTDYRYELPVVPAERSGTSAEALAGAIEAAGAGALRAIPLKCAWDAEQLLGLVNVAPELGARLIANLRTGPLWGTHPPLESVLAELAGEEVPGPPPEWDVGHYCELAAVVRGGGGTLVAVHDSYPGFGWNGVHLQPPRALAAALRRGDGREGGVLCVLPAEHADEVDGLGFEIGFWDNGTRR
jgi:hypothetical protein